MRDLQVRLTHQITAEGRYAIAIAAVPRPILDPGKTTKESKLKMAKSQKRSNREIRKPKATKAKESSLLSPLSKSPVSTLMEKPRSKH